jgi:hypothetical protein
MDTAFWLSLLESLPRLPSVSQRIFMDEQSRCVDLEMVLDQSPASIHEGGEWKIRTAHLAADMHEVAVEWMGTPCTNCGAVSPVLETCPLCGYDKENGE